MRQKRHPEGRRRERCRSMKKRQMKMLRLVRAREDESNLEKASKHAARGKANSWHEADNSTANRQHQKHNSKQCQQKQQRQKTKQKRCKPQAVAKHLVVCMIMFWTTTFENCMSTGSTSNTSKEKTTSIKQRGMVGPWGRKENCSEHLIIRPASTPSSIRSAARKSCDSCTPTSLTSTRYPRTEWNLKKEREGEADNPGPSHETDDDRSDNQPDDDEHGESDYNSDENNYLHSSRRSLMKTTAMSTALMMRMKVRTRRTTLNTDLTYYKMSPSTLYVPRSTNTNGVPPPPPPWEASSTTSEGESEESTGEATE